MQRLRLCVCCCFVFSQSQDIEQNGNTGFGRLYRKSYMDDSNILPGNCEIGGLLPEGRKQHLKNGE